MTNMGEQAVGLVYINVDGLKNMGKEVNDGLRSTKPGPMLDVRRQWAFRYRSFSRERYDKFSKGGGDWPALKPATIAARRHGGKGRFKRGRAALESSIKGGGGQITILRDTNQLFTVLSPIFASLPGQVQEEIPFGILVGFGGPSKHKTRAGKEGKFTIGDIAAAHQVGDGNLPQRKILVEPPDRVQIAMIGDMERGLQKVIDNSQVPSV